MPHDKLKNQRITDSSINGASLSKPHIDELNVRNYYYGTYVVVPVHPGAAYITLY